MTKSKINYFHILLGIITGVVFGMIIMFFLFVMGVERIAVASNGIIDNINIQLNETKLVDSIMNWTYKDYKFSNYTTFNYTNCNGLIDKGCGKW